MKKITPGALLVAFSAALSFSACRTLSTTAGAPPSGPVNGVLYYLPIGKITIKGEFKTLSGTDVPDDSAKVTAEPPPPSLPPTKPGPGSDGAAGAMTISAGQLTITLTPEVEADETAGEFYVTPHTNYVYEDETRVTANAKQLLSTGNVTTEDKTADIVGAVAAIASKARGLGFAPQKAIPEKKNPPPFYFSFHPSNYTEYHLIKSRLALRYITLKLDPEPKPQSTAVRISTSDAKNLGEKGLIFRPATSYKITLQFDGIDARNCNAVPLIDTTQQFVLPDPSRLYEIEYPRMAFVKKVKEIGFTNGMLTDFHQKVPSPILGFLGIPKAIVQAIVPIPGAPGPSGSAASTGTTPPKN